MVVRTSSTLVLVLLALASLAQAATRPHIVLMVLDDIGRTDSGIYGKSNIAMPNIVKLASEGAVLENFYTQPCCSPTRSSLLTGKYPFRFGMQHSSTQLPGMTAGIPLDTPILAGLLKNVGYDTHAIGKWHVGYATEKMTPTQRGFNTYLGYLQAQGDYFTHNTVIPLDEVFGTSIDGLDFWDNDKPLFDAVGTYSLDLYDERITKILNDYSKTHDTKSKQAEHPLFIYLAHQTVHIPLQPRKDEHERCGHFTHAVRRIYCDMLVELDDSIGSMVEQFKQHGLWDNTLILTLTDNGGMTNWDPTDEGYPNTGASQGSNFPLRGSKMTLFDGGVRSLGFLSGGYIPAQHRGQRYTGLAHVVDLSATILAVAELFPVNREKLRLDGTNLWPLLTNSPGGVPRSEVPINIVDGGLEFSAIRFGKYKVIVRDTWIVAAHGWFDLNGDLYEPSPKVSDVTFLFDLEQDVEERHNLASERPELVRYGLQLIQSYVQSGNYMEPQETFSFYPEASPKLHGGVWRPFMSEKTWRANFRKQQAAAGLI